MNKTQLANYFDHTFLKPYATEADLTKLCNEAKEIGAAMVAINTTWTKFCKEQLKGSYILGLESTSSRMMSIGRALLLNNKVESTDDILKSIDNVDRETVKIVIDKIFNLDKLGVCIVGRDVEENKL